MANAQLPISSEPEEPASGLRSVPLCPGCGQDVDPWRAGHVAVRGGGFRYFCNATCKQHFLSSEGLPQEEEVATARPPEVGYVQGTPQAPPIAAARHGVEGVGEELIGPALAAVAAAATGETEVSESLPPPVPASWVRALPAIDATGIFLGVLVPAIGLLGSVADVARVPLVLGSWGALALRVTMGDRDAADPSLAVVVLPTLGAVCAAFWAHAAQDPREIAIAVLAGLASAGAIVAAVLVARSRAPVRAARERIESSLRVPLRVVRARGT